MKILVVEDEFNVREGLVSILRMNLTIPHLLKSCASGEEALVISEHFYPDLVITDIVMQSMNGLDLIRKLKERGLCTTFIIVSGHENFQYAQQAIRYGVKDYILKPIDKKVLLDTIQDVYDNLNHDTFAQKTARPFLDLEYFSWELDITSMPVSLQRIIDFVKKNYMKEISQQSISEELFYHPSYISSLVNKHTGHSFTYLLDYIRIRKAVELLLSEPDLSINEVSVLVGYNNERRLYAAFQKRLNLTPGDLRKMYL